MKKIIIAPDSFKESLTAVEVADAIEKGFKLILPAVHYIKAPMADGGEGTTESLVSATGGTIIKTVVKGPLHEKVESFFGILGDGKTAVIEMAAASGLHLVPNERRNPLITTTFGTGELIRKALDYGIEKLIVGIGGSATNDGGAGMASALGVRFLNRQGQSFFPYAQDLHEIDQIDVTNLDPRLKKIEVQVACDVSNPLIGIEGASYIYGPQKGAKEEDLKRLDENLEHFGWKISEFLKKDVLYIPGSGAAGGLGAGLIAFLNAELKKGIDVMMEATNLESKLVDVDLVITGEGQINHQTPYGKTPIGVAKLAKKNHIPVIAIAGSYVSGYEEVYAHGIDGVFSAVPKAMSLQEAFDHAEENVVHLSSNIARLLSIQIKNR